MTARAVSDSDDVWRGYYGRAEVPGMSVDDVQFVAPCGFVLFAKPRYRVAVELLHWLGQSELHLATW